MIPPSIDEKARYHMTCLNKQSRILALCLRTLLLAAALAALAGCGQLESLRGGKLPPALARGHDLLLIDPAAAVKEFDKAIAADRNNIDVYIDIMRVCAAAGKIDLVAQYGETANGSTSNAPPEKRAAVLYMTGVAYLQLGNTAKAIDFNEAALKLRPNDPSVMNNLGYSLAEHYELSQPGAASKLQDALELTRKAVSEARRAGATDKDLGIFMDSLGWVHYKLQNYDEAVVNLSRAAHLAPDQKEIHVHLAQALHAKGRTDEARIVIEKALKIDPHYGVAREQLEKWGESAPPDTTGDPKGTSDDASDRPDEDPASLTVPSGDKRDEDRTSGAVNRERSEPEAILRAAPSTGGQTE